MRQEAAERTARRRGTWSTQGPTSIDFGAVREESKTALMHTLYCGAVRAESKTALMHTLCCAGEREGGVASRRRDRRKSVIRVEIVFHHHTRGGVVLFPVDPDGLQPGRVGLLPGCEAQLEVPTARAVERPRLVSKIEEPLRSLAQRELDASPMNSPPFKDTAERGEDARAVLQTRSFVRVVDSRQGSWRRAYGGET